MTRQEMRLRESRRSRRSRRNMRNMKVLAIMVLRKESKCHTMMIRRTRDGKHHQSKLLRSHMQSSRTYSTLHEKMVLVTSMQR
jgi:hypothetical protein